MIMPEDPGARRQQETAQRARAGAMGFALAFLIFMAARVGQAWAEGCI